MEYKLEDVKKNVEEVVDKIKTVNKLIEFLEDANRQNEANFIMLNKKSSELSVFMEYTKNNIASLTSENQKLFSDAKQEIFVLKNNISEDVKVSRDIIDRQMSLIIDNIEKIHLGLQTISKNFQIFQEKSESVNRKFMKVGILIGSTIIVLLVILLFK